MSFQIFITICVWLVAIVAYLSGYRDARRDSNK